MISANKSILRIWFAVTHIDEKDQGHLPPGQQELVQDQRQVPWDDSDKLGLEVVVEVEVEENEKCLMERNLGKDQEERRSVFLEMKLKQAEYKECAPKNSHCEKFANGFLLSHNSDTLFSQSHIPKKKKHNWKTEEPTWYNHMQARERNR